MDKNKDEEHVDYRSFIESALTTKNRLCLSRSTITLIINWIQKIYNKKTLTKKSGLCVTQTDMVPVMLGGSYYANVCSHVPFARCLSFFDLKVGS